MLISVSALFGSCQKEHQELTQLNLIAEGFKDNGAKLAVDGLASSWVDGEQIEDYNNRSGWTDDGSNTFWGS